ncbi:hypothetical protein [Brevundimonas aurantiaca]|uniref:hypothetical protein n=1 Tax=Brevundimonas aurantiaca TaxID=74316 RepID=UPI002FDED76C
MIRLLVNVPPHVAGARIAADVLDADFVQRLIDAGQAEEVADETPADPAEVVQDEVFELIDQIDAAVQRRSRIVLMVDGLEDGPGKAAVKAALETASQVRPELFGLDVLPLSAEALAREEGLPSVQAVRDMVEVGAALVEAVPEDFVFEKTPAEFVASQTRRIAELEAQLEAGPAVLAQAEDEVHALQAELAATRRIPATSEPAAGDPPPAETEAKGKKPKA